MTPYLVANYALPCFNSDDSLEDDKEFEVLSGGGGDLKDSGAGERDSKNRKRRISSEETLHTSNKKLKLDMLEV